MEVDEAAQTVAALVATKVASAPITAMADRLREVFGRDQRALRVLGRARNEGAVADLAAALQRHAEGDAGFAAEMNGWAASAERLLAEIVPEEPGAELRHVAQDPPSSVYHYIPGEVTGIHLGLKDRQKDIAFPTARLAATWALGTLHIKFHGSWSTADFGRLLGRLDDAYKAAAALESLAVPRGWPPPDGLSADELIQNAIAFQTAGGLRLGSLHYGSPGFLTAIGAFSPLKTVKDGITENREINLKRDSARRQDERDRERQQQNYELEAARIRIQAEESRFKMLSGLIDRLPREQRTAAAAQLIQSLSGITEEIANDARIDDARMLEQADTEN